MQALGQGLGTGFLFVPCSYARHMIGSRFGHLYQHGQATSVISHWFKVKRTYAVGLVIADSSFGGTIFPIILNNFIGGVGFASAVWTTACLILGCLTISYLTISPRLSPMKNGLWSFRSLMRFLYLQTFAFNVGEMGVRVGIGYFVYPFAAFTGTPISGYVPHHLVAHF